MSVFSQKPSVMRISAPPMNCGAPDPAIFAGDALVAAYRIDEQRADSLSKIGVENPRIATGELWSLIHFDSYLQIRYGYPNEDGFFNHPLYSAGLEFYAVQEIINSPWLKELAKQDESELDTWSMYRHWLMSFHDETLEVLSRSEPQFSTEVAASAELAIFAKISRKT